MDEMTKWEPMRVPVRQNAIDIEQLLPGRRRESDFDRYLRIIFFRKWWIIAVSLTVFSGVVFRTFTTVPLYTSTTTIQIDPDYNVLPYQSVVDPTATGLGYIGTQSEIFRSRTMSARVVEALNLERDPQKILKLADSLRNNLQVTPKPGTRILRVDFLGPDPEFVCNFLNTIAEEFVRYESESKYEAIALARDHLERELRDLREKIERSEKAIVEYASAHEHVIALHGQDNYLTTTLKDLQAATTTVDKQLLSNRYTEVKDTTPNGFPNSMKTSTMTTLEARLAALEQQLSELSSQYGPRWPAVKRIRHDIAVTKQLLADDTQSAIQQLKVEYELAQNHRRRLLAAVNRQKDLVQELAENSIQYNILKREVETDEQLYNSILQRLKQAGVSADVTSRNIRILETALLATSPSSPDITLNLTLGGVVGLMLGILLAFAAEFLVKSIDTPDDVAEELELPMLGTIPQLGNSWDKSPGKSHLLALTSRAGSANSRPAMTPWCRESYRSIRTKLLSFSGSVPPKILLVTSAVPSEGKTTTSLNLADSLAMTGQQTLLLELDMRAPQLATRLNVTNERGISQYLSGRHYSLKSLVIKTENPNLFAILSGPRPPHPAELLGSERFKIGLSGLSNFFDYIVIDSPPILAATDALIVATMTDGVLLVVRGRKTPTKAIRQAQEDLRNVGAKILGVVINDLDPETSGSHYYKKYDAYYSA